MKFRHVVMERSGLSSAQKDRAYRVDRFRVVQTIDPARNAIGDARRPGVAGHPEEFGPKLLVAERIARLALARGNDGPPFPAVLEPEGDHGAPHLRKGAVEAGLGLKANFGRELHDGGIADGAAEGPPRGGRPTAYRGGHATRSADPCR